MDFIFSSISCWFEEEVAFEVSNDLLGEAESSSFMLFFSFSVLFALFAVAVKINSKQASGPCCTSRVGSRAVAAQCRGVTCCWFGISTDAPDSIRVRTKSEWPRIEKKGS